MLWLTMPSVSTLYANDISANPSLRGGEPTREELRWLASDPLLSLQWSREWFGLGLLRGNFWQSYLKWSSQDIDDTDLALEKKRFLWDGEVRLGVLPMHLSIQYLYGLFRGKGQTTKNLSLENLSLPPGENFQSKLVMQDLALQLEVGYQYFHPYLTVGLFFFGGGGFFATTKKLQSSLGTAKQRRIAPTVRYGIAVKASLFSFLTLFLRTSGGSYKNSSWKVARMSQARFEGGIQLHLGSHAYIVGSWRIFYWRMNKKQVVDRVLLHGPTVGLVLLW